MKEIIKGIEVILHALFVLFMLFLAGIGFYLTTLKSGFFAVGTFIGGLLFLTLFFANLYIMGSDYQTEKGGADNDR